MDLCRSTDLQCRVSARRRRSAVLLQKKTQLGEYIRVKIHNRNRHIYKEQHF